MVFVQKVLASGPGTRPKAIFRYCPFQSALSGSLFLPSALPEVVILYPVIAPFGFCEKFTRK